MIHHLQCSCYHCSCKLPFQQVHHFRKNCHLLILLVHLLHHCYQGFQHYFVQSNYWCCLLHLDYHYLRQLNCCHPNLVRFHHFHHFLLHHQKPYSCDYTYRIFIDVDTLLSPLHSSSTTSSLTTLSKTILRC